MDVFTTLKAMPNKLLNKDGSITDFKGNIITPADPALAEVYERSKSIANKFLNNNGEVKTYAEISVEIFEVVDVLPEIGEKNKIYLVPSENGMFDEYFWNENGKWDKIGEVSIDLSNYPNRQEVAEAIAANSVEDRGYVDEKIAANSVEDRKYVDEKIAANSVADREYTDEKIDNIHVEPNVFYYMTKAHDISEDDYEFWNKVYNANKHNDVFVFSDYDCPVMLIKQGSILNNNKNVVLAYYLFNRTSSNDGTISNLHGLTRVNWYITIENDICKEITFSSSGGFDGIFYLDPKANYTKPFIPKSDGSPATKKYVDDTIKASVTNVLGGEY